MNFRLFLCYGELVTAPVAAVVTCLLVRSPVSSPVPVNFWSPSSSSCLSLFLWFSYLELTTCLSPLCVFSSFFDISRFFFFIYSFIPSCIHEFLLSLLLLSFSCLVVFLSLTCYLSVFFLWVLLFLPLFCLFLFCFSSSIHILLSLPVPLNFCFPLFFGSFLLLGVFFS